MLSRRDLLSQCGTGFGMLGLAGLFADQGLLGADAPASPLAAKSPHFAPRAKRIIHLYMNGGPSQVDTFDPKPALLRFQGQRPASIVNLRTENGTGGLLPSPFKFVRSGKSGLPISHIFPEVAKCADDLCVIRSMHTNVPNHEPSMFMMNSGHVQSVRPSYGSWLLYGLGTENQNLPGYVVLGPGQPVNGAANWSNRFLPGIFQGTHLDLRPGFTPRTVIEHLANSRLSAEAQRRQLDLIQSMNRLQIERRGQESLLEARIASFEMAYRMQTAAPEAFDINQEPEAIRSMYGLSGPRFRPERRRGNRHWGRGFNQPHRLPGGGEHADAVGSAGLCGLPRIEPSGLGLDLGPQLRDAHGDSVTVLVLAWL
jgi:hypothetical protein